MAAGAVRQELTIRRQNGLLVSPEVVDRLLEDQVQDREGQHEVGNLAEGEVSEEPDVPVVALHVGVGHRDEAVAPG